MNVINRLFQGMDSRPVHSDVDEELQFHLDLLTEELCRQNMPRDEAQTKALERFGNLEQIRDECVRISRRNHPAVSALKWFFGLVFVTGVLVRVFSSEFHLTRVGDILMAVGVLSRLLLYLRVMSRSGYVSQPDDSSLIKLNDGPMSLAAYDRKRRTPVERLISFK